MRVLIDTSFADRGPSGTAVYIDRLTGALRARGNVEVVETGRRRRPAPGRSRRHGRVLWSALNLLLDGAWTQIKMRLQARRARAVGILGADPEAVVVAPHGPGQALPGEAAEAAAEPRHFLYVGDDEPRKRVPALLEAHRRYASAREDALPLVLAGTASERANGQPLIVGEPRPDGARLRELFAGAAALVHPSLEEGFGLTLAEAMASGVAVLAVCNPGMHEPCGPAALMVDPDGPADGMRRLHYVRALRAELAHRGRERARDFSWEESARLHEEAYAKAAG